MAHASKQVMVTVVTMLILQLSLDVMASNCTWKQDIVQPKNGSFCSDFDVGHAVPANTDPVGFGEATCATAPSSGSFNSQLPSRAFFYGMDKQTTYVWCSNTCDSGCATSVPQCEAVYKRQCVGPPPPPPPAPPGSIGGLVLVPQEPRGAACLDGTAPGYWMEKGVGENATRWVLHAQGGGWCWNEAECLARSKSGLGSSKGWGESTTCYGECDGILSKNCTLNPDFCTWSHVFIGYCDGSSFSGRVEGLHQGLHYRGRPNLDAVLDSLIANQSLATSEAVVFTGGSAGGLTTYLQIDHVASRLPNVNAVKGLGDAGWFLDALTWNGANVSRTEFSYAYNMWNSSTGVNDACVAANAGDEGWRCIFAQYTYPHITTPTFVAEGAYDSWQMGNILKLPCHDCSGGKCSQNGGCPAGAVANCCNNASYTTSFLAYGVTMKDSIRTAVSSKPAGTSGAFVSGCIVHCQTIFNEGEDRWDAWEVGGRKPREVFRSFFFGDGGATVAIDELVYPQNPSCPVWT
eukprot:m.162258 g.162258  ORF g.162258 m.162258 type:complete len:518 (-) comp31270_c0_seq1:36-1589(-)